MLEQYARPGSVLGHEWSGTVVAVGDGCDAALVGAQVVANPTPGCGTCRACTRGRPSVCLRRPPPDHLDFRGAFCRYVVVAAARLLPIPSGLSLRAAALTEPTAIALHTVNISGAVPGDRVLITGAGPVGLLTMAVLPRPGIDDITVAEPAPLRRRARARNGRRARRRARGVAARADGTTGRAPYTLAFECSGHAAAAEAALDQLDYAGTLVFVGTGHELPRVNHNRAIVLELTLIGAYNYDADGFAAALALLASGTLPLDDLIEADDVHLDALRPTMDRLAAGELAGKVLVRPEVAS